MTHTPRRTLRDRAAEAAKKEREQKIQTAKSRVTAKLGHQALFPPPNFKLDEDGAFVTFEIDGLKFDQSTAPDVDVLLLVRSEDNYVVTDLADLGRHLEAAGPDPDSPEEGFEIERQT